MSLKLRFSSVVVGGILLLSSAVVRAVTPGAPVRVVIVGLVHDHALGLLHNMPNNKNVELVGIAEPDAALQARYAKQFHLDQKLFFTDTDKMLDQLKPDAVLVYTDIQDHRKVIEQAAKRGIASMVEKPLATNIADAIAIRKIAKEHHVEVLVNFETTWYASNARGLSRCGRGQTGLHPQGGSA